MAQKAQNTLYLGLCSAEINKRASRHHLLWAAQRQAEWGRVMVEKGRLQTGSGRRLLAREAQDELLIAGQVLRLVRGSYFTSPGGS